LDGSRRGFLTWRTLDFQAASAGKTGLNPWWDRWKQWVAKACFHTCLGLVSLKFCLPRKTSPFFGSQTFKTFLLINQIRIYFKNYLFTGGEAFLKKREKQKFVKKGLSGFRQNRPLSSTAGNQ